MARQARGATRAAVTTAAVLAVVGSLVQGGPWQQAYTTPSNFWEVANSRRSAAAAAAAALCSCGRPAEAFEVGKNGLRTDVCWSCAGEGLSYCFACKGTGQFKMIGDKGVGPSGRYQYVSCPDCEGVGKRICGRCFGTGLPSDDLKGCLRDPAFKKVLARMKTQRIDASTINKLQAEAREAVEIVKARKAAKAAEEAANPSSGFFNFNLF